MYSIKSNCLLGNYGEPPCHCHYNEVKQKVNAETKRRLADRLCQEPLNVSVFSSLSAEEIRIFLQNTQERQRIVRDLVGAPNLMYPRYYLIFRLTAEQKNAFMDSMLVNNKEESLRADLAKNAFEDARDVNRTKPFFEALQGYWQHIILSRHELITTLNALPPELGKLFCEEMKDKLEEIFSAPENTSSQTKPRSAFSLFIEHFRLIENEENQVHFIKNMPTSYWPMLISDNGIPKSNFLCIVEAIPEACQTPLYNLLRTELDNAPEEDETTERDFQYFRNTALSSSALPPLDWSLLFKCLSVVGGLLLVAGFILNSPTTAVVSTCLLGVGALGWFSTTGQEQTAPQAAPSAS